MQKITVFLWYDKEAKDAAELYVSIFKNSKIKSTMPGPNGTVSGITFELEGQEFYALNGGPQFEFTPAISLFINCETQDEIDYFWNKLSEGGRKDRCGWLTDRFGVSWQVVPQVLGTMLSDPDPIKANKVMQAMLKMDKIEIAGLEQAYNS